MNSPVVVDAPPVRAYAPTVYAAGLGVGLLLHAVVPRPLASGSLVRWVGVLLLTMGLGLVFWGRFTLDHAGTTASPYRPATRLVIRGPYRFSRNPMYLAMTICFLGVGLLINALWLTILVPVLALIVQEAIIKPEETHLVARFGPDYQAYRARVRRWL
jgi:protein-S-isoprenylcysteine O-methyltransferase Ste14